MPGFVATLKCDFAIAEVGLEFPGDVGDRLQAVFVRLRFGEIEGVTEDGAAKAAISGRIDRQETGDG